MHDRPDTRTIKGGLVEGEGVIRTDWGLATVRCAYEMEREDHPPVIFVDNNPAMQVKSRTEMDRP